MNKIKTILMGTPEFAERIFREFYSAMQNKFEIVAVVTAQDKPVGRKQVLTPPPVKKWALENNLPVLQPDKIRKPEWIEKIRKLNSDLIILTGYGQIISKEILDIPKYKALNIHPSLLPKYRGASPIQSVILNGDKETGVTIILMDEEIDHGPIVASTKLQITNSQTYKELENKLIDASADLLIKTLPDYIDGKIKPQLQNHSQATFCKLIKKEDGKINWNKSAIEIERQIRAYAVWPTAYTEIPNHKSQITDKLKILNAEIETPSTTPLDFARGELGASKKIGEVFLTDDKELAVQTGNGILILKQVQLESKKPMSAKDFLHGHSEIIGSVLQ